MGSYPVPGDWFDNVAAPGYDEDEYDYAAELAILDEDDDYEYEYVPRPRSTVEPVQVDPISAAVRELRALASRLAAEHHPLAHVPQQIANELVDVRGPAPTPVGPYEPSPTGNCAKCGRPLPLPTMGRGRPRTLCLTCSPRRR